MIYEAIKKMFKNPKKLWNFVFQVEGYWDECLALPSKLKDWDAYHDLKTSLQNYLEVFPLLRKLNSKVTIAASSRGR